MLNSSTKEKAKKKKSPWRWVRRGALVLLLVYVVMALAPCAFPPQLTPEEKADTSWMTTGASDLHVDRALLVPTGQQALDTRLALIQSAQSSIDLGSYIFASDESGRRIASALLAAADRGVKVRLITDGLVGSVHLARSPLGAALGSHPNIEIKFFNPINLLRPQGLNARYHEKFFIVDETWLLLGGRNVSDEFLTSEGDPHYNYDQDVLMYRTDASRRGAATQMGEYFDAMWNSDVCGLRYDDPKAAEKKRVQDVLMYRTDASRRGAATQMGEYFDAMWNSDVCGLRYDDPKAAEKKRVIAYRQELSALWQELTATHDLTLPDPETDMVDVEKTLLLANPTDPASTKPVLWERMCQLMETAQERLWIITPYLVMDGAMRDTLTRVCQQAPADAKLLVNSRQSGNNIIASADYTIHRPMAERLGIPLWEFHGDWSIHTKSVLIDHDLSLIGSFNFDPRSAYLDTELMVAVYSEGLNEQLAANMDARWAQSLQVQDGEYLPGAVEPHRASFWKMASIVLLSPFISLVRFLA